eukprot:3691092-Amphidinium_carterae.1
MEERIISATERAAKMFALCASKIPKEETHTHTQRHREINTHTHRGCFITRPKGNTSYALPFGLKGSGT